MLLLRWSGIEPSNSLPRAVIQLGRAKSGQRDRGASVSYVVQPGDIHSPDMPAIFIDYDCDSSKGKVFVKCGRTR